METQASYSGTQNALASPIRGVNEEFPQRNPQGPPPSTLLPGQKAGLSTQERAGATSGRRRLSGHQNGRYGVESFNHPPAAPEVPKAPPLAFRAPPITNGHDQSDLNYPPSFAERARILTGIASPQQTLAINAEQKDQAQRPKTERRASLNRPIGGLYNEIQKHKRDSYPSTASGPTSPRRFSVPASTQQQHPTESVVPRRHQEERPSPITTNFEEPSSALQSIDRRSSATQRPRKEWASDRSPLQNLEAKLEKRARVEQAEHKLRRSKAGSQKERRPVEPSEDHTPTRRVSAGPELSKSRKRSNQPKLPSVDRETSDISGLGISDTSGSRSLDQRKPIPPADLNLQGPTVSKGSRSNQPKAQALSRGTSIATGEHRRVSQQQDRSVRFHGEDDPPSDEQKTKTPSELDFQRRNRTSGSQDLDPASAEARAARREQMRHSSAQMDHHEGSKEETLRLHKGFGSGNDRRQAGSASYGKAPNFSSGEVVNDSSRVLKHEIPPQTVSGIQARQKVGFGSQAGNLADVPAQKSHHFSKLLHHGREHPVHEHEQSEERPQNLDEWRQGGVARLTAVDFSENTGAKDDQIWMEGHESARRRRSQRASRGVGSDAQMKGDDSKAGSGKRIFHSIQSQGTHVPHRVGMSPAVSHTRPYTTDNDSVEVKKSLLSLFKTSLGRSKGYPITGKNAILSSTYSYSCPELAVHDPSHTNHICEPYLSPELIQSMRSIRIRPVPGVQTFSPPLYLKCGPLLRYTGLKRNKPDSADRSERETWRGSVMIVTTDAESEYEPSPTLRLFPEPMELLPPPPQKVENEDPNELPSEIVDPIAGLPKLSRTGKTVYVKPVDDLGKDEDCRDLSRVEDDDGLFEETRTAAVPTSYGTPDFHHVRNGPQPKTPPRRSNARRGQLVRGIRLHAERGVTFWRFNLEVELVLEQARVAYSINNGPAVGFWVPARNHTMNVMFHSCNGFSMSVKWVGNFPYSVCY